MPKPKDNAKGSPQDVAVAYLNVLLDDADPEELTAALGRLARVSGGPKLVEKVELSAPAFRRLCMHALPPFGLCADETNEQPTSMHSTHAILRISSSRRVSRASRRTTR